VSQRLEIQRHLAKGHTITPMQAFLKFGCLALSQRCTELRRDGWPVKTRMVNVNGKRVAQYSMGRK